MPDITIIKEMQIKTAVKYHFTCTGIAMNKKSGNKQVLARVWRNQNHNTLLLGVYNAAATIENTGSSSNGYCVTTDPGISLPGIGKIPKRNENIFTQRVTHPFS